MNRSSFLFSTLATMAAPAVPKPSPTVTPFPWDKWDKNLALPYDHPLEINMELLDAGKQRFQLTHYRGQPVLLNIFASWCGPCNWEQPHIVAAAAKYAPQGLVVIGINSAEDDDVVRAYRKKYGITFPIAMDRKGALTYNVEVGSSRAREEFPLSLFITPDGYLYGEVQGSMSTDELDYRIPRFLAAVSQEMRTPAPSPSPTPG